MCVSMSMFGNSSLQAGILSKGDVVYLDRTGTQGGALGGGEFAMWKQNLDLSWQKLAIPAFCIEYNEHIGLGVANKMIVGGVSDRAVYGGVGGHSGSAPNTYDMLDNRTKFLYEKYATNYGSSTGWGDTNFTFDYNSNVWANAFQEAVWNIEQERTNTLSSEAQKLVNFSSGKSGSGVFAVNLFAINTPTALLDQFDAFNPNTYSGLENYRKQDQLFYSPGGTAFGNSAVPEPASLVVWLGLLAPLAKCRSRFSKGL